MKYLIIFILFVSVIIQTPFYSYQKKDLSEKWASYNYKEAQKAFNYLNLVRSNPKNYSKLFGVDISYIAKQSALIWNDTLAKIAESKAMDMANRNYFSHINPDNHGINILLFNAGYITNPDLIKDSTMNAFESISSGYKTGIESIIGLIIDKSTPNLGHRHHLLGHGEWYSSLNEIGIGFVHANDSYYPTYMCVIIAKRI